MYVHNDNPKNGRFTPTCRNNARFRYARKYITIQYITICMSLIKLASRILHASGVLASGSARKRSKASNSRATARVALISMSR